MATRFIAYLIIFLSPLPIQAKLYKAAGILYKTAEKPSPKDPELYLLREIHRPSKRNVETIVEILREHEKKGDPFHVLIENANLYLQRCDFPEGTNLLSKLMSTLKKESSTTIIEDIETRKVAITIPTIWMTELEGEDAHYKKFVMDMLNRDSDSEMEDYLGKVLKNITYQDFLDEVQRIFKALESMKKTCVSFDQNLHRFFEGLEDICHSSSGILRDFIEENNINLSQSVFEKNELENKIISNKPSIEIRKAQQLDNHLTRLMADLFDFYPLTRIIELLNEGKRKIMLISGGTHIRQIWAGLKLTKKFIRAAKIGTDKKRDLLNDHCDQLFSNEVLKNLFAQSLYIYLVSMVSFAQALEEEEATRYRKMVLAIIIGLTCEIKAL